MKFNKHLNTSIMALHCECSTFLHWNCCLKKYSIVLFQTKNVNIFYEFYPSPRLSPAWSGQLRLCVGEMSGWNFSSLVLCPAPSAEPISLADVVAGSKAGCRTCWWSRGRCWSNPPPLAPKETQAKLRKYYTALGSNRSSTPICPRDWAGGCSEAVAANYWPLVDSRRGPAS